MSQGILQFIQAEPLLSLIIVLLFIVGGVFLYQLGHWIYIHYIRRKSTEFKHLITDREGISILLHHKPDPDAMSSALALQRLAEEVGTEVSIEYPGWITHPENRAFRAVLDLSFTHIDAAEDIEYPEDIVLVDHQEPREFEGADEVEPFAVIDHHDSNYSGSAEFVHIESDIGACVTLIVEYLTEQGVSFSNSGSNPDVSEALATAIYYGIKTDTADFSLGISDRDYRSAQLVYSRVNTDDLFKIANPKIDSETFDVKSRAFHSREIEGPFAISHVGEVSNSDTIPQAADELSRLEGISAVIIIGDTEEGHFRLSGRTYDSRVHMGAVLEQVIEDIEGASAGGHTRMGGAQIPKEAFSKNGLTMEQLKEDLFAALNGNY